MTTLDSTFLRVERDGPVALILLNRPDKANSMTPDFWADLPRIVDALARDESVRCAILAGEGRHFTGGMDLAAFASLAGLFQQEPGRAAYAMRDLILSLQNAFNALERARLPVIAAIHGACVGAGIDMITACDLRIASADAYFSVEEIHIGMAADVGTLQRLPKLIAPAVAAELAYSGRRFQADEAKAIGLVSAVHADKEALMDAARQMAHDIAKRSPLAIAGIKRNLAYARDHSVADGLDYIATWNAGMLRPGELIAAVQAKMTKQEAEFADLLSDRKLG
ncbi:MAG: crotonase/enoyl-CoA hydratase family protein [Aquamicrobium sp.]|uniref:crotonase/enoyl-CoA hydratase family protein n=1 Tax=Aquamicrobium sp. TaxID=1872579 RepID=UPI00349E7594|nr:crotonase/enoyl-CoA hydratase family protein [Aquamicrobium sp.]